MYIQASNHWLITPEYPYIRQALYMPALSSSRLIPALANLYKRINEKNKCKKVGLMAVSRKLLILTYTLWKNEENFK